MKKGYTGKKKWIYDLNPIKYIVIPQEYDPVFRSDSTSDSTFANKQGMPLHDRAP